MTVRKKILLIATGIAPVLCLVVFALFTKIHGSMILLRDVQAGDLALNDLAMDELTIAAITEFEVREQHEVIEILEGQQNYVKAEAVLHNVQESIAPGPSRDVLLLRLARNAANAKWLKKSVSYYEQYIVLNPHDVSARHDFAGVLLSSGFKAEALNQFNTLIGFQPENKQWYRDLADAAISTENKGQAPKAEYLSVAERALQTLLKLDERCDTRKKLAMVLSWQESYDDTLEMLRPCGLISLDERELVRTFAEAYTFSDKQTELETENIISLAEQALHTLELSDRIYASLARAMRRLDVNDKSLALFDLAVRQTPDDHRLRYEYANLLHDTERYGEAEIHYTILLNRWDRDKKGP